MINLSRDIKKYISVGIFFIIPIVWAISLLVLGKIVNSDFGNDFNAISDYSIYISWMRNYIFPESLQKILYIAILLLTFTVLILLKRNSLLVKDLILVEPQRKYISQKKMSLYLFFSTLVILLNIWDWAYKLRDGIWVNQFHSNYVLNASNDVANGKTLLVDTFSVYGSGFIYLITFIMKLLGGISYTNLYLTLMIANLVYFLLLAVLILYLTKSFLWSILTIWLSSAIVFNFNVKTFPSSEQYEWPGGTPLRFMFDILVFYLFYLYLKDSSNYKRIFILGFTSAFSIYWNFETGSSLSLSILILVFIKYFLERDRKFLPFVIRFLIGFFSSVLLVSTLTYLKSGNFPRLDLLLLGFKVYGSGFTSRPVQLFDWYLIPLFISLVLIIAIFHSLRLNNSELDFKLYIVLGMYIYFLLNLNYFWSRSYSSNLWILMIPFIVASITTLMLIIKSNSKTYNILSNIGIVLLLITLFISINFTINRNINRFNDLRILQQSTKIVGIEAVTNSLNYTQEGNLTIDSLKESLRIVVNKEKSERAVVLSHFQGVLLTGSGKSNFFPYPLFEEAYVSKQIEETQTFWNNSLSVPNFIFIDRDIAPTIFEEKDSVWYSIFLAVSHCYEKDTDAGFLSVYKLVQSNCKMLDIKESNIPRSSQLKF
jgi:hypothetical protein